MSTYSFLEVVCALTGPGAAINLAAGAGVSEEGITFTPSTEIDTMQIGADGSGQHSLHADKSGRVMVRILKTSPTNYLLSAAYAFQTANPASHGQNTITLVDTIRGDAITAQQVAFAKAPELTFAKEAGLVEWEFNAIIIDRTLGNG